jgi:tripartite-type tricarboxylate transporter receptor subunit TctC
MMTLQRRPLLLAMLALATGAASAFPDKDRTLRLVVPFAAGGGVDAAARLLATQLQKQTGATVVVENKAGGSGTIGGRQVQTATTHVLARQVLANAPYDPQADFVPVARVGEAPLMLVIAPSKAPTRLQELITAVRAQPDRWTAGIPAAGAPSHLATLKLAQQGQLRLNYVPYKGTQPALMDVAGGHTDLLLDSMIALQPLVRSGKVRALAISSAKRSALAPEVPTFRESGLADFVHESWYGVWAPKGTPADRVGALNAAINTATAELARTGAWAALGVEPVSETPEQFRRHVAQEVAESAELLRSAGFRPE